MKWTDMQHAEMARRFESGGTQAVADYALELAAERGDADPEPFAKYHAEQAHYGGASFEFHARAETFLRDQGATVATLTAWLADVTEVLCGERPVGAMPSTTLEAARALKATAVTLQAKIDVLASRCDVLREKSTTAETEMLRYRAETERLKAELEIGTQIVQDHASRLAAVRMCLLEHDTEEGPDFVETVNGVRRALEGDAPNSPEIPDGSGDAQQKVTNGSSVRCQCSAASDRDDVLHMPGCPRSPVGWRLAPQEAKTCTWGGGECSNAAPAPCGFCNFHCGHARGICSKFKRYPCSPTCTHDNARIPGHPERIANLSARLAAEDDGGVLASDEPHPERVKADESVCEHGTLLGLAECATCDGAERAKERSEALEQLVWSKERSADWRLGFEDGKESGAEAMRSAAEKWAREYFGDVPPTLKQALDEVAP